MLPIKRPVSNFNFGGNQLWENDTNNNSPKEINNKIIFDLKAINKCPNQLNKNITIKNRNIAKSFDVKGKSSNIIKNIHGHDNVDYCKLIAYHFGASCFREYNVGKIIIVSIIV